MERLNANDMLRVINELLSSKNAAELLVKLQLGLKPIAEISDILVLTQDANQLCALTSTFEPLCGVCLLEPSFVKKVFERNVCAANICQLPNDWILPSHCNETVIFVANNFAERKGVFVLFIKGGDDIGRMENALSSESINKTKINITIEDKAYGKTLLTAVFNLMSAYFERI